MAFSFDEYILDQFFHSVVMVRFNAIKNRRGQLAGQAICQKKEKEYKEDSVHKCGVLGIEVLAINTSTYFISPLFHRQTANNCFHCHHATLGRADF